LKKNPNCCYIASFKCNLSLKKKIVIILQSSSATNQRNPKKTQNCCHVASFKCDIPKEPHTSLYKTKEKHNWNSPYQRKCKVLFFKTHEGDDQDEDNDDLVLLISPEAKEKRGTQQWQWWMSLREGKKPRFEV
jgi:hypothetical protein